MDGVERRRHRSCRGRDGDHLRRQPGLPRKRTPCSRSAPSSRSPDSVSALRTCTLVRERRTVDPETGMTSRRCGRSRAQARRCRSRRGVGCTTRSSATCCSAPTAEAPTSAVRSSGRNPVLPRVRGRDAGSVPRRTGSRRGPRTAEPVDRRGRRNGDRRADALDAGVTLERPGRCPGSRDAYFDLFPGVWRHGDWMTVTRRHLRRAWRSDSTINRGGVRMGSADVYAAVDASPRCRSLVVGAETAGRRQLHAAVRGARRPGAEL